MSKTERLFPLNTMGGKIQNRRINFLKKTRPEFYDLVRPGENIENDSKSRTIKNWESGDTIPDIDTIKKICTILKCSSDYLLGLNECTSKDIQFIQDKTGLSEDSINALISLNESDYGFYYTPIIDCLLKDEKFTHHLMNKIDKHFRDYKHYRDLDIIYSEERKTLEINPLKPQNKKNTVSRHDLTLANDLAEAGHFQIQREFDYILSTMIKSLYDNYPTNKAPGTN